jgi:hypothetical protein
MSILHAKRIVAIATLMAVLVLSGCGHASGLEVAEGVGNSVLAVVAADAIADCNDNGHPRESSICEEQTEAVMKFGQSVYSELKPAEETPSAEELSNDLNTFIEKRRTPPVGNKDDTKMESSP